MICAQLRSTHCKPLQAAILVHSSSCPTPSPVLDGTRHVEAPPFALRYRSQLWIFRRGDRYRRSHPALRENDERCLEDANGKAAASQPQSSQSQSEGIETRGSSDGEFEFDEATLALIDGKQVPSAPAVHQVNLLPVAAGAGAGSSSHTPVDLSADSE